MGRRTARTVAAGALALALLAPAGAQAAGGTAGQACYRGDGNDVVRLTGTGFTPGTDVLVLVDGGIVATARPDAAGTVTAAFAAPVPLETGPSPFDQGYTVRMSQADTGPGGDDLIAETTFRASARFGDFTPSTGVPARLRVSFSAFGFAVGRPAGAPMPVVYVHYVDPRRRVRRTISLGTAGGPCGTIRATAKRRLFPFNPRRGRWTLQFDTSAAYRRSAPGAYRLGLTVS